MCDKLELYRVLLWKPQRKSSCGRTKHRCKNNILMAFKLWRVMVWKREGGGNLENLSLGGKIIF
jgi:hypothetical protein